MPSPMNISIHSAGSGVAAKPESSEEYLRFSVPPPLNQLLSDAFSSKVKLVNANVEELAKSFKTADPDANPADVTVTPVTSQLIVFVAKFIVNAVAAAFI